MIVKEHIEISLRLIILNYVKFWTIYINEVILFKNQIQKADNE
jgi:hypothetical protein